MAVTCTPVLYSVLSHTYVSWGNVSNKISLQLTVLLKCASQLWQW